MSDGAKAKVCIIIGSLRAGGAERVAVWLADELDKLGCEVAVVTYSDPINDFYRVPDAVQRDRINVSRKGSSLFHKLLRNLDRITMLRRYIKQSRASHVIAFMPHESVLATVSCFGLGVRVVVSERNAPWHRSPGKVWERLRRLVYRFSAAQVVQTDKIAQWLRKEVRSSEVFVIPNAVQWPLVVADPVIDPSSYLQPERKILLAVGSKPFQKGLDLLVDAFSIVANDHKEWDLVILPFRAGNSERHLTTEGILQSAESAGIRDRIVLPGFVGNIQSWYEAADIFVLSSRFEGFPNSLIEAMAAGKACVAYACDTGPEEIIRDGIDGLLVRELTPEALACTLSRVMDDPALRERLAREAPHVAERYAPNSIMTKWCEVLALEEE